jgi:iron-sulfur cluster assembly accessory protein
MTIEISPRAAHRLQQITSSSNTNPQTLSHLGSLHPKAREVTKSDHLRVSVTSGGCHGFQYLMSLEPAEKISEEEDTIFAASTSQGEGGSGEGEGKAVVVMDEPSLELLRGSTIDYTMELIGSQFKVVGNPRAKSSCGCGTSFDVSD